MPVSRHETARGEGAAGASLDVVDLGWGPAPRLRLIDDIRFSIPSGARLAIVGPNGAGKTSLLRCLYRGAVPQRGRVALDGRDLQSLTARKAARRIAVVLQEMPADFPFTVHDIVMMGRIPHRRGLGGWSEEDRACVARALDRLSLGGLAVRLFASLSGGEKQRVLVARALAQAPDLVILDEPTNHLDIRHQLEILDLLRGLGLTIVTTLHDIDLTAGFATHAAIMSRGRLLGFGPPDDVLTSASLSATFGVRAVRHVAPGFGARYSFSLAL